MAKYLFRDKLQEKVTQINKRKRFKENGETLKSTKKSKNAGKNAGNLSMKASDIYVIIVSMLLPQQVILKDIRNPNMKVSGILVPTNRLKMHMNSKHQ